MGSGFQPGEDADALLQGEGKGSGFQPGEDEMEEMASEQAEAVAEQRAQAAAPASSQTPHTPAAAPGAGEDAAERRRHLMHGDDYPPGFSPLHRIIIIIIMIIIIIIIIKIIYSFYLRISCVCPTSSSTHLALLIIILCEHLLNREEPLPKQCRTRNASYQEWDWFILLTISHSTGMIQQTRAELHINTTNIKKQRMGSLRSSRRCASVLGDARLEAH